MRYESGALRLTAEALLRVAGMDGDKATVVAEILVEGDLLGHPTHGIALLPDYLADLASGAMNPSGDHEVVRDTGPTAVWDGRWLSGVWLTATALDVAAEKASRHGIGVIAIRHAHHIACLQAYLRRVTDRGLAATIFTSDPSAASVAPFGGIGPVLTPDPIAVGIPTSGDPILIDMSSSITTNGMVKRVEKSGGRLPGPWLIDGRGQVSDDPRILTADPPGALLPTGGMDHGHKGYGLGLTVESLTQGLSGYGRKEAVARWTSSVLVQVYDPVLFAGADAFRTETDELVRRVHQSPPVPGGDAVRLPGEGALRRKQDAVANGVTVARDIMTALGPWAERYGLQLPQPVGSTPEDVG
jgi:LDH2 family malate/lactate/ureidoglycolate dehydrogenase